MALSSFFFLTPLKKAATKKACTLAIDVFHELFSIVHGIE